MFKLAFISLLSLFLSSLSQAGSNLSKRVQDAAEEQAKILLKDLVNNGYLVSLLNGVAASHKQFGPDADREIAIAQIQQKDKAWRKWARRHRSAISKNKKSPKSPEWINKVLTRDCSAKLNEFLGRHELEISEVFVIDSFGVTACTAEPTTDFDQGDEGKFKWTKGTSEQIWYIAKPKKDNSSGEYQVQVATYLKDKSIDKGIIVFGIRVDLVRRKIFKKD